MNGDNGFKSFFIKGLVIILVAIIFLVMGVALTIGILAAVNRVSPSELIRGGIAGEEQNNENGISAESEASVKEEAGQDSDGLLLRNFNNAISEIVEKVTP